MIQVQMASLEVEAQAEYDDETLSLTKERRMHTFPVLEGLWRVAELFLRF